MVVREHQLYICIYFDVSKERDKKKKRPKKNEKSGRDEKKNRKVYNYNQWQLIEKGMEKERDVQFAKL